MPMMQAAGGLCMTAAAAAVAFAGLASGPSPIPPPLAQESADCMRPVYATDQLVCLDAQLRRLDADIVARATRVREISAWPGSSLFEDQQAWFKRRSLCAFQKDHRACVAAAYRSRITELDALLDSSIEGASLRCKGQADWRISPGTSQGSRIIADANGSALLVAFPAAETPWVPFVRYRVSGKRLVLQRLGERKPIACVVESRSRLSRKAQPLR